MPEPVRGESIRPPEDYTNRYTELVGRNQLLHPIAEGKKWSTQRLHSEYVRCTDGIIGRMDGTIPIKQAEVFVPTENGLKKEGRDLSPPFAVIYIDKSARPVMWMVNKLWPILARVPGTTYKSGVVPEKQKGYTLNINKEDWLRQMGVPEQFTKDPPEEMIDIHKIDKEHFTRIRALYNTVKIDEDNLDDAWKHPTIFDGQHIMVVDESRTSGATLNIAKMLLTMAIPEAVFSGAYWSKPPPILLNGGVEVEGRIQKYVEWVPVWYNEKSALGRGVGDRSREWPKIAAEKGRSVSRFARVGRHLLSTPTHDLITYKSMKDEKAQAIRTDIDYLAEDLAAHRILYQPSRDRPSETDEEFKAYVARITEVNDMDFKTWQTRRTKL